MGSLRQLCLVLLLVALAAASNVNRNNKEDKDDNDHHDNNEHHDDHEHNEDHEDHEHDVESFLEAAERLGFDADLVFDVASELRDSADDLLDNGNNAHLVANAHHVNNAHHVDHAAHRAGNVVGNLAESGARIALKALTIQSKLVSPLVRLGVKVKAPVLGLKAKLAKPLVFAGAVLAKPFIKKKVKVGAPLASLAAIKAAETNHIFGPLAHGVAEAISPVTDELRPLQTSLKPLKKGAALGLVGVHKVADKALSQTLGLREDVEDIKEEVRNILGTIGLRDEAVVEDVHHHRDPRSPKFSLVNTILVDNENNNEAVAISENEVVVDNEAAAISDNEAVVNNEDDDDENDDIDTSNDSDDDVAPGTMFSVAARFDDQCEVSNPSLFTSECARVEEYRTRVCTAQCGLDLGLNNFDLLCQQAAPGFQCQKSCFTNSEGCIVCSFKFVRVFIGKTQCNQLNRCLLNRQFCDGRVQV